MPANTITDFTVASVITNSLKLNKNNKKIGKISNNYTRNAEIIVTLKYISNFWKTLYEIIFYLNRTKKCVAVATDVADQDVTFLITGTKLHVPSVTLSIWNKGNLLQQIKSG